MVDTVAYTIQQFIEVQAEERVIPNLGRSLNDVLRQYGQNGLTAVYPYDRYNIGTFDLPCIVLGDVTERSSFFATDGVNMTMKRRYAFDVTGYAASVALDDDVDSGRMVRRFMEAFRALWESTLFKEIPTVKPPDLDENLWTPGSIYFQEEGENAPPVREIKASVDNAGEGALMRIFTAELVCFAIETIVAG